MFRPIDNSLSHHQKRNVFSPRAHIVKSIFNTHFLKKCIVIVNGQRIVFIILSYKIGFYKTLCVCINIRNSIIVTISTYIPNHRIIFIYSVSFRIYGCKTFRKEPKNTTGDYVFSRSSCFPSTIGTNHSYIPLCILTLASLATITCVACHSPRRGVQSFERKNREKFPTVQIQPFKN